MKLTKKSLHARRHIQKTLFNKKKTSMMGREREGGGGRESVGRKKSLDFVEKFPLVSSSLLSLDASWRLPAVWQPARTSVRRECRRLKIWPALYRLSSHRPPCPISCLHRPTMANWEWPDIRYSVRKRRIKIFEKNSWVRKPVEYFFKKHLGKKPQKNRAIIQHNFQSPKKPFVLKQAVWHIIGLEDG